MKKKYFPQSFLQSILLILLPIVFITPILFLKNKLKITDYYFSHLFFILFIINVFFYFHIKNKKSSYNLKFNFRINKTIIILATLIITFQLTLNIPLNFLLNSILNENKINIIPSIAITIPMLIIASIFEELIFRGMILKGYLIRYKANEAIIYSALFFGIIHINPIQIIGAIVFGFIVGYIYYYSRSVGMTIILHAINNMIAGFGVYLLNNYGSFKINKITDLYGDYSIYVIIASFLILLYTVYHIVKNKEQIINKLKQLDASQRLPI